MASSRRRPPIDGDPQRTWIEIELTGLTPEVMARIKSLAETSHDDAGTDPQIVPVAPERRSQVMSAVGDDLPADERELFQKLSSELRRLRQVAAHEVLGVPRDAEPRAAAPRLEAARAAASPRSRLAPQRAGDHAPRRGADDPLQPRVRPPARGARE